MTDYSTEATVSGRPAKETAPNPNDTVVMTHSSSQGQTATTSRQAFDEYWSKKGWTEVTETDQPETEFHEEGWE